VRGGRENVSCLLRLEVPGVSRFDGCIDQALQLLTRLDEVLLGKRGVDLLQVLPDLRA
jgi:hypothetical protein